MPPREQNQVPLDTVAHLGTQLPPTLTLTTLFTLESLNVNIILMSNTKFLWRPNKIKKALRYRWVKKRKKYIYESSHWHINKMPLAEKRWISKQSTQEDKTHSLTLNSAEKQKTISRKW